MISEPSGAEECFAYITLPGETDAVTAGRFALTTGRQDVTTGRFVYGRSYLARPSAVEINQVPPITKRHLGIRAVETREPIRVIVLRALEAYGVPVPDEAISDRRKMRAT